MSLDDTTDGGNLGNGAVPDPFDPERLRLSQDFAKSVGVRKLLTTVPVKKPSKESWIQVHPDPAYRLETAVLELKEDREIYLVDPSLWGELSTESTFSPRALFTTITRQQNVSLWPIRMPGSDGKLDDWNKSAHDAAGRAIGRWVRISANMSAGFYDVFETTADIPAPTWPEISFTELLRVAFRDKFITSMDHPVLRRLRGEI